jgi:hypothetical protein
VKTILLLLALFALGGCAYESDSESDDPGTTVACNCAPGREPTVDAGVCVCTEPAHDCSVRRVGSSDSSTILAFAVAFSLMLARRRVR